MTRYAYISRIAGLEERIAEFAAKCISICDLLPRGRAGARNFKDQLARSATSVAANYAEATVPLSRRDFVGRLTIAMKELAESRMHLSVISRLGYRRGITSVAINALVDEADAIAKILSGGLHDGRSGKKKEGAEKSIDDNIAENGVVPRGKPGRKKKIVSAKKKETKSEEAAIAKTPTRKSTAKKRKTTAKRKQKSKTAVKRAKTPKAPKNPSTARNSAGGQNGEKPTIKFVVAFSPRQILLPVNPLPRALPMPPTRHLLSLHEYPLLSYTNK